MIVSFSIALLVGNSLGLSTRSQLYPPLVIQLLVQNEELLCVLFSLNFLQFTIFTLFKYLNTTSIQ